MAEKTDYSKFDQDLLAQLVDMYRNIFPADRLKMLADKDKDSDNYAVHAAAVTVVDEMDVIEKLIDQLNAACKAADWDLLVYTARGTPFWESSRISTNTPSSDVGMLCRHGMSAILDQWTQIESDKVDADLERLRSRS
jgi:hypothetical protein